MSKNSIQVLFEAAGLKVLRENYFRVYPVTFYFRGVRPLLRLIYDKIQIYELVPFSSSIITS
jgi:hypothetical protein